MDFNRFFWVVLIFLSIFLLASTPACAKKVKVDKNVVLERGALDYHLYLSYTTTEGIRLSGIRLDEGPFLRGDLFVLGGKVYEFVSYEQEGEAIYITFSSEDDVKTVWLSGYNLSVEEFQSFRAAALTDAREDYDTDDFENDFEFRLDPEDLFFGYMENTLVWFDDSSNAVFFATGLDDVVVSIEPSMVGELDLGEYTLRAVREENFYSDLDSLSYDPSLDLNGDSLGSTCVNGNDDDLLIVFGSEKEDVVVDFSDRGYDEFVGGSSYLYKNGVGIYSDFGFVPDENQANLVAEASEDLTTRLFSPLSHVKYFLDWGVDNELSGVTFTPK